MNDEQKEILKEINKVFEGVPCNECPLNDYCEKIINADSIIDSLCTHTENLLNESEDK